MNKNSYKDRTFLLFDEIKTAEQLRTRIDEHNVLSIGNRYKKLCHLFTVERTTPEQEEVTIEYTNRGKNKITRFV